jgi:IS30 family transposase
MAVQLTEEQRTLARRLRARRMTQTAIAKNIGCSPHNISVLLRGQKRLGRPDTWISRAGHLTMSEREEILVGLS